MHFGSSHGKGGYQTEKLAPESSPAVGEILLQSLFDGALEPNSGERRSNENWVRKEPTAPVKAETKTLKFKGTQDRAFLLHWLWMKCQLWYNENK